MSDYEIHIDGRATPIHVYDVDYFEIAEDGVLVFYKDVDPMEGDSINLADVDNGDARPVEAFSDWQRVQQS